jgi:hypothetical protein
VAGKQSTLLKEEKMDPFIAEIILFSYNLADLSRLFSWWS